MLLLLRLMKLLRWLVVRDSLLLMMVLRGMHGFPLLEFLLMLLLRCMHVELLLKLLKILAHLVDYRRDIFVRERESYLQV